MTEALSNDDFAQMQRARRNGIEALAAEIQKQREELNQQSSKLVRDQEALVRQQEELSRAHDHVARETKAMETDRHDLSEEQKQWAIERIKFQELVIDRASLVKNQSAWEAGREHREGLTQQRTELDLEIAAQREYMHGEREGLDRERSELQADQGNQRHARAELDRLKNAFDNLTGDEYGAQLVGELAQLATDRKEFERTNGEAQRALREKSEAGFRHIAEAIERGPQWGKPPEDRTKTGDHVAYWRLLPNEFEIVIYPRTFGAGTLALSEETSLVSSYDYPNLADALVAAVDWNGEGDPAVGWCRHMNTGRRRPHGDPDLEYIEF